MPSFDTSLKARLMRAGVPAANATEVADGLPTPDQTVAVQALVSEAWNPRLQHTPGVPGINAIDFSTNLGAENTMVAQGGTCTIVYNPTGWHDGTGCLEFTPTGANPTIRALLSGNLPFTLNGDDGFGFEMMLPLPADATQSTSINFMLGTGGVSAGSLPTVYTNWTLYYSNANVGSQLYEGVIYRRYRLDIANTDLKRGPVDGANAMVTTGGGITKFNLINWWCIYAGNFLNKTIKIKRVTVGGRARPQLVQTFDINTKFHQTLYAPYMQAKNKRISAQFMTFAWDTDAPYSSLGSSIQSYRAGWAAGGDMNANDIVDRSIAGVGYTIMLAAARQMIADMARVGFGGTTRGQLFWVYNNNSYDTNAVSALVDAGFIAGRAGSNEGRFTFTEGGIRNSMRLGSVSWDGASVQSMQDQIARAVEYGCTIHIYFHKLFQKAKLAADLPAATVPGATESPSAYITRLTGLAESVTLAYLAVRGVDSICSWWEDIAAMLDFADSLSDSGSLDMITTSDWMRCHSLIAPTK